MSHHGVIRSPLEFLGKVQKGFSGFKKDLDIPTLSVNPDNFFICQL
jgi:hypothetical protein